MFNGLALIQQLRYSLLPFDLAACNRGQDETQRLRTAARCRNKTRSANYSQIEALRSRETQDVLHSTLAIDFVPSGHSFEGTTIDGSCSILPCCCLRLSLVTALAGARLEATRL